MHYTYLSIKALHHLVSALPHEIVDAIEGALHGIERKYPGYCKSWAEKARNWSSQPLGMMDKWSVAIDIQVLVRTQNAIDVHQLLTLRSWQFDVYQERSTDIPHLTIRTDLFGRIGHRGTPSQTDAIIVPVPYILSCMEDVVLAPDRYQVYQHSFKSNKAWEKLNKQIIKKIKKKSSKVGVIQDGGIKVNKNHLEKKSRSYIGLTSRAWQTRFKEHQNQSNNGSHLLFHKALRGEFGPDYRNHTEHIVLRAGLSGKQADWFEEVSVQQTSWCEINKLGLNMIPGGRAGYKYLQECGMPTSVGNRASRKHGTYSELAEYVVSSVFDKSMNNISRMQYDRELERIGTGLPELIKPSASENYWDEFVENVEEIKKAIEAVREYNTSLLRGENPKTLTLPRVVYSESVCLDDIRQKIEHLESEVERLNQSEYYEKHALRLAVIDGMYLWNKALIQVVHASCGTKSYVFRDVLRTHGSDRSTAISACKKRGCYETITGIKLASGSHMPSREGEKPGNAYSSSAIAKIIEEESSGVLCLLEETFLDVRKPLIVKVICSSSKYDGGYIEMSHTNARTKDLYKRYAHVVRTNGRFSYKTKFTESLPPMYSTVK